jgi:hypothetical protein
VIQRLLTSLRALSSLPEDRLGSDVGKRLAADCADALRLELDCPQQDLTSDQRRVLSNLSDLLESERWGEIGEAVRSACELRGYVTEAELQRAYSESVGLLLLSDFEAFGLPISFGPRGVSTRTRSTRRRQDEGRDGAGVAGGSQGAPRGRGRARTPSGSSSSGGSCRGSRSIRSTAWRPRTGRSR